ncbi:hypothetical protein SAV14893_078140 [Streptomyces avermitilis]|uniref:Uncharacterized protein n=1 Tax=Streptomyces avermitilis TaxID=33903 RepID=A0A4D4M8Y4_STRAX|nr:hypothetical protein SAV14893_078140 [Streptomyces avermitilis]
MQVEEVHVVRAQALETSVERGAQPLSGQRRVLALIGVRNAGLGGENHPFAAAGQQLGEDALALPARVAVGGVHTGDARIERGVHHRGGRRAVCGVAEGHRAEDERGQRDGDVREFKADGHGGFLPRRMVRVVRVVRSRARARPHACSCVVCASQVVPCGIAAQAGQYGDSRRCAATRPSAVRCGAMCGASR